MLVRVKKYFTYNYNRNIVELFKPLYILLSFTGLFPYTIVFPKGRQDTRMIRKSLISHSIGAILLIVFLSYYFTQKVLILMNTTAAVSSVTNISNIIEISLAILCDIVIYYSAFWNAEVYLQILKDIATCWADLSHTNVIPILTFLRGIFIYSATAWLVIFSCVQIALCIIGPQKVYNQLIFFTVPEAIPSLTVAFYSTMVLLVVALLKNIEQHCQIIIRAKQKRVNCLVKINSETNVREVSPNALANDCVRLDRLEQMYVRILEIKQAINIAFQAPISLIAIQCFHGILTDAHTVYRELVITMRFDAHLLLDQIFWVLYSLAKVYALSVTGTMLKNEATKIGQALHNIPTENQDNRLLIEVQHFASMMSFRKPEITAYGYFSLDANLLFSMIATAVTYLVILVQFDSA